MILSVMAISSMYQSISCCFTTNTNAKKRGVFSTSDRLSRGMKINSSRDNDRDARREFVTVNFAIAHSSRCSIAFAFHLDKRTSLQSGEY